MLSNVRDNYFPHLTESHLSDTVWLMLSLQISGTNTNALAFGAVTNKLKISLSQMLVTNNNEVTAENLSE